MIGGDTFQKGTTPLPGCRFEFQLLDCHRYAGSKKLSVTPQFS
jgi:hypothetical protein